MVNNPVLGLSFSEFLSKAPRLTCNNHLLLCVLPKHALWTEVILWLQMVIHMLHNLHRRKLGGDNVVSPPEMFLSTVMLFVTVRN